MPVVVVWGGSSSSGHGGDGVSMVLVVVPMVRNRGQMFESLCRVMKRRN